jgi:predicted metal-binding membrane protein
MDIRAEPKVSNLSGKVDPIMLAVAAPPGRVAVWLIGFAALAGWIWIAMAVAAMAPSTDMATLGPGMGIFNQFNLFAGLPESVRAGLSVLCSPIGGVKLTGADIATVFAMWVAMVLAMMLPAASPMLIAYTSAEEGGHVVSSLWPLAGYLAVWLVFAIAATGAQVLLTAAGKMTPAMTPANLILAATTLIGAGIYQFTPLKVACLARCRMPPPHFGDLSPSVGRAFRDGLRRGQWSVGCSWALMSVMFAVGVMNVVWIVILGVIMAVEKAIPSSLTPRFVGVGLIVWGVAILLTVAV